MTAASLWMPLKKPVIHNRIRYQKSYQAASKMHWSHCTPSYQRGKRCLKNSHVKQPPFPAIPGCRTIHSLGKERAKLQRTWKTTTSRNIFSKGISNQQLYLQATARKKILVRTKRNLTSSGHNLNLECQIWSTSNLELSLWRIVGEIF